MRSALCLAVLILSSCSSYTYQLVEPADTQREILKDKDLILPLLPVEYRLERVESHVVILIYNRGETPLSLDGGRSVISDPNGQSHPIDNQLIPPGNFVKIILPPLPAYREQRGPQLFLGVGIGGRVDAGPSPDGPVYLSSYAGDDSWSWNVDGTVRLTLAYTREGGPPFTHTLGILKAKN